MINRIFFISDTVFMAGEKNLPADDGIYFSILVDPSIKKDLENAYDFMEGTMTSPFALTLNIRELPPPEIIRFIVSFLFLPSYLRIEQDPVVNLSGNSEELLLKTESALSDYVAAQGIDNIIITKLLSRGTASTANNYHLIDSPGEVINRYKEILQSDQQYNNAVFFYGSSSDIFQSTVLSLLQMENEFKQNSPKLYSLVNDKRMLEKEIAGLRKKIAETETELSHQKQYNDILRSGHTTKELQDYYDREYEVLPVWYKRFGHILKVITGKRTFRSLFRDDVKKYKS